MAEIVLAPLLQVIFDKIADPVLQEFADHWELDGLFKKLQNILPMAQAVVQDAGEHQATDKAVRVWLSQLKDAACKVEDLLEEFMYKKGNRSKSYAVNFSKTRKILDDLQKALVEGLNLPLAERNIVDRKTEKRETSSFLVGSEVCGREEDKKKTLEMLLQSCGTFNGQSSPVVSIIGTPGIGKSTLAQMVYNDDEVRKDFNLRIWVFVSPDFKVKRIIKAAIESATGKKCDLEELDALQIKLWNTLHQKKFLLVLDDVWNEDQDEWDKLRFLFSCGYDGSRILVTTRSQKITMVIGSSNLAYHLKGLCEEDCWALFKKRAFLNQLEEENHPELLAVGKEIVRKCQGVPLAAKVLGGLMRFKKEEMDWLHVQNSDLWDLRVYRNGMIPALLVSYLHLPPHLKHCFVFCSIFPKNHEIERKTIIHMWMTQGFILSDGESRALEDIGDEYFHELLWMSVFEEIKEFEGGSVRGYKMNETFYSLARFLGENEFLVLEQGLAPNSLGHVRHVSFVPKYSDRPPLIPETLSQSKHLRTLLVFSEGGIPTAPLHLFSSFIYLRELKLSGCQIELPESIGDLSLLRYLDVSHSHFRELPSSISSLRSLQVLNLFGCYNLNHLPQIDQITGLRHLDICGCEALVEMPYGIGKMVYLQTLPIYIVPILAPRLRRRKLPTKWHLILRTDDSDSRKRLVQGSLYAIQHLDLRDELKIKHLERVYDVEKAKAANLTNKAHLKSLGLCWGYEGSTFIMNPALEANASIHQDQKLLIPGPSEEPETSATVSDLHLAGEILEGLQPHKNLKKLFIVGYPGFRFPLWTLPNLIKVVLINCEGCVHLPILGHLPLLKSLHMEGMSKITSIGQEFYGEDVTISFPWLQELFMRDFPSLHEWSIPDGKDIFPVLSKLIIRKCQNLVSIPLFMSLKHLELHHCNSEILKCMEELSQLSTVVIDGFGELISVPENLLRDKRHLEFLKISSCPKLQSLASEFRGLASLKSLTIRWCDELSVLPQGFQNLTALESLEISDCHSVITLPENVIGHLRSLQTLSIENCSTLTSISLGFQHLTTLEYLAIMYCPSLAAFPDNSEHLYALRSLAIISCPLIEFLPDGIKNATALWSLEIRSCPRITYLPEWLDSFVSLRTLAISDCHNLKSLPVAVRRLRKLQHLSIQDCPHLQRRCQQDRGEDWWKIAHVPHRYIFSSQLQQSSGATSNLN
ncbi:hypothetical protein Pfo_002498 [Paulownia fortunei]|nr:hypothetical protein Pfo_002498 [Paulownia fortunei]